MWSDKEINLLKEKYGTMPARRLAKEFFPNRTYIAIHKKALKLGLKSDRLLMTSISKKQYTVNDNFFHISNKINCYWAGFIGADGWIIKKNNSLGIALADKDKNHLFKFKNIIDFTGEIYNRKQDGYLYSSLNIYGSPKILQDLYNNFSIIERKSLIIRPPNIKDESNIKAYIRGYIDGDGSITYISQGDTWRLSVLGGIDMMKWISLQIEKFVGVYSPNLYKDRNCFVLVYGGFRKSLKVLDWLYSDSTLETRLDRKYEYYLKMKERCIFIDSKPTTSQFVGVYYDKSRNLWCSRIEYNTQKIYIGRFNTEKEAALAYNTKARKLGLLDRCYEVI